jgi:hypothetical protein
MASSKKIGRSSLRRVIATAAFGASVTQVRNGLKADVAGKVTN